MNAKLKEAVAIFKELGWESATEENAMLLPLGTPEQKRTAIAGLKSGEWGGITKLDDNSYGYRSYLDVNEQMLSMFAVRVGVDARRGANILRAKNGLLEAAVVAERGEKYAEDFIKFGCVSRTRLYEHAPTNFGCAAVWLVDMMNLEIPQNVEYLKDWSAYAAAALELPSEVSSRETDLPGEELIQRRFIEHIKTGVAVGAPATGPFGAVFPEGVKRGWLPRDMAVELVFSALDAAVRPGDRKVWLDILEGLEVGADELCLRTDTLIPLLSTGDANIIERLAPTLIAGAKGEQLIEVITAAFSATTKKARLTVLKAAVALPCPNGVEALSSWLSLLAADKDKSVSATAARLMLQWGITAEIPEEEVQIQNLWQKTPPLWQVPAFTLGEASPEALTELAAEVVRRSSIAHDVLIERFLAVCNAVAYSNPAAARTSLRGLRTGGWQLLYFLQQWVKEETPRHGFDTEKSTFPLLTARDCVIAHRLGTLPCLLSTPSYDDLSITLSDLTARLEEYNKKGVNALEADLFLALTRLNTATKAPESAKRLKALTVPVELQSGKTMSLSAGKIILNYLDDPIKEPSFIISKYGHWKREPIVMPDSLRDFPARFKYYSDERFSTFPLWGDHALGDVRWDSEVYHEKGLVLRQVARRAAPLPPGGAINMLAAQRSSTPYAAEDSMLAVTEAWERGLLRPGIADVGFLDWSASPPSNLAALAAALESIARDGILSVVWPVLDSLIEASLNAVRVIPGTAEIAELILEFLPEVESAIKCGNAESSALALPGIRALAKRGGSSRGVTAAQAVEKRLPAMAAPTPKAEIKAVMDPPFEAVWSDKKSKPPIEDGITITVDWANPQSPTKLFLFTLTLPNISDKVFQVVNNGWHYDLESEGQCHAYPVPPGATDFILNRDNRVWLHWDNAKKAVVVCEHRNWVEGKDGPLKGVKTPPLPISLLTIIIGLQAQDGDAVYYAPRLLRDFIEEGQIGAAVVQNAAEILLKCPVVSPAKLVRSLEKDVKLLSVLWPLLTESIKTAGAQVSAGESPPVWVNRVLETALRHAPYLAKAGAEGLIPPEAAGWTGLSELAASKSKSAAVAKAKKLHAALE